MIEQGIWKHWKGGEYDVIGVALWRVVDLAALLSLLQIHDVWVDGLLDLKPIDGPLYLVVYRPRQGERRLEVRPVTEWLEHVTRENYRGPRFWLLMTNREGQKP